MTGSEPAAAEPPPPDQPTPEPVEERPAAASSVFGDRLHLAERFADLLVGAGVVRGVIGPHEPSRIWTRHLLNCAVVAELFPVGARVVDVGSGAGLPGLALAIARPDLRMELVEPLQRRVDFLTEAVAALELDNHVRVIRGRADEPEVLALVGQASWVTARAVAPLDRLVRWCLPLLAADGRLALIKGASAAEELERHRAALGRAGGMDPRLEFYGAELLDSPVPVITVGIRPKAARKVKKKGKR